MHIIRGLHNLHTYHHPSVVTIGNFDGVHLGHQALVSVLVKKAKELNAAPVVITFEPQPNEFFNPNAITPRLMRFREKILALEDMGVEHVLSLRFDKKFSEISAENFVKTILIEGLNTKHIIVGDDFKFGKNRAGDSELLKKIGMSFGFTVESHHSVTLNSQRVSSTLIREALERADLAAAEKMLGRPFGMSGKVAHGHKRGRIIGFPTANIFLHRKAVPISGVFAVKVFGIEKQPILGVANVGTRPTVDGTRSLLEVHLFDFDRSIYGEHIYVEFVKKMRDEKKYDSFEALKAAIFNDAKEARAFFINLSTSFVKSNRGGEGVNNT